MPVECRIDDDGIAVVTLQNPARRNALDEEMFRQLDALWPRLAISPARCVVLTGAPGAFCSGADLSANLTALPDIDALIDGALLKSRFFPKPLIAAIDGACVAGGFELMLSCDVRLCSTGSRFGLPEARWGIFPAGGGAAKLLGQIGSARATELLLSGRIFGADEAMAMGLVNRQLSSRELFGAALEFARMIAANSPAVLLAIKQYLHAAASRLPALKALELELTVATRTASDAVEGQAAFLEKRAANYAWPTS